MAADGTATEAFPLRQYLRACVEAIAASFDAAARSSGGSANRRALDRFLRALDDLGAATDRLAASSDASSHAPAPAILVAGAEFADSIRAAGCEPIVLEGAPAATAILVALERQPAVLVARMPQAEQWIAHIRQLHPCFPAIAVADEDQAAQAAAAFANDPVVVLRSSARAELPLAVRALAALRRSRQAMPDGPLASIDPRSYAHLAGLLPRAPFVSRPLRP